MSKPGKPSAGERIRMWRRIRGMTQKELARHVRGLDQFQLCRIESGKQRVFSERLERIVSALGLTMAQFYGEPEERAS